MPLSLETPKLAAGGQIVVDFLRLGAGRHLARAQISSFVLRRFLTRIAPHMQQDG